MPASSSERMSRVRQRGTAPELELRLRLHARGLRYRTNDRRYRGTPDLVFTKSRTVLFVHGCFWHRHFGCKRSSVPKTNTTFWLEKFARNVERDLEIRRDLEQDGWAVLVEWECEIRRDPDGVASRVEKALRTRSYSVGAAPPKLIHR